MHAVRRVFCVHLDSIATTTYTCGCDMRIRDLEDVSTRRDEELAVELRVKDGHPQSVPDLLWAFQKEESLLVERPPCSECAREPTTRQRILVAGASEILMLVVNREVATGPTNVQLWGRQRNDRFTASKHRTHIEPTKQITIEGTEYNLRAVVVHRGTTVNSGHYLTYILNSKDSKVWCFDDARRSELSALPEEAFTDSRLLFYERGIRAQIIPFPVPHTEAETHRLAPSDGTAALHGSVADASTGSPLPTTSADVKQSPPAATSPPARGPAGSDSDWRGDKLGTSNIAESKSRALSSGLLPDDSDPATAFDDHVNGVLELYASGAAFADFEVSVE